MSDAASLKQKKKRKGQVSGKIYVNITGSLCNRRFDLRCEIFQFQLPTQQVVRRSDTVKSKIDHPIERGRQPTELGDVLEGAKVFAGHGAIGGGSGRWGGTTR